MKNKALSATAALLLLLAFTPASVADAVPRAAHKREARLRDRDDRPSLSRLFQKIARQLGITTNEDLPLPPRP